MSFILDAIAKSEQERQQQLAPDARRLAVPVPVAIRETRKMPYVLLAALVLNAVLVGLWMQTGSQPTPGFDSGKVTSPALPEPAGKQPALRESQQQPVPSVPAKKSEPAAISPVLANASRLPSSKTAASQSDRVAVVEPVVTRTGPDPETTAGTPVEAVTEAQGGQAIRDSESAGTGLQAAFADTPAPVPAATGSRHISRISDLPSDVRRALPSVVFTGHLYSSNPRASYVFVGDRQVVVGQQIVDNLVLDAITPTGVVVEFQDYLIEVGVLQNWSLN